MLLLAWLLPFAGQVDSLFGLQGWFDRTAYAEMARLPDGTPSWISWSLLYLVGSDPQRLAVAYWLSIALLALFTVGVLPRLTAILAWAIAASFIVNPAIAFEADFLLVMLAFYMMVGYLLLGQADERQSNVRRLLGPLAVWPLRRSASSGLESPRPSVAANLALRLLQVNMAIVVLTNGLHKLQFGDWWAGVALWYPLYPPFQATLAEAASTSIGANTISACSA